MENSKHESARQREIINRLKDVVVPKELTYFITTFGCQMNAHDSEKLKGIVEQIGYKEASDELNADLVIFNTCAIRENAENRVYGRIGRLKKIKRKNKNLKIAICGCMMQQNVVIDKLRESYGYVDIVFGTHNLYKLAELLEISYETNAPVYDIWENYKEIVEDLPAIRKYKFKSSVNIMFGCNNFCTYCIVPYVRGRERSREKADILKEIRELVADGVVEVTLLGQNVNSYGRGLKDKTTFSELLKDICKIDGLRRVRFMTSHPKDLSDDLIDVIANEEKVCKHLHLPFQSGSTRILKAMNRGYTKEHYMNLVEKLKKKVPNITLTSDIIVGFPTETDEDVKDTIEVINAVKYSSCFTFIYSKRTGTRAAIMENGSTKQQISERFNKVLAAVDKNARHISENHLGKVYEVLVEEVNSKVDTMVTGRLDDFSLVHLKGSVDDIGKFVNVKIIEAKGFYMLGKRV